MGQPALDEFERGLLDVVRRADVRRAIDEGPTPTEHEEVRAALGRERSGRQSAFTIVPMALFLLSMIVWPLHLHSETQRVEDRAMHAASQDLADERARLLDEVIDERDAIMAERRLLSEELADVEAHLAELKELSLRHADLFDRAATEIGTLVDADRLEDAVLYLLLLAKAAQNGEDMGVYLSDYADRISDAVHSIELPESMDD